MYGANKTSFNLIIVYFYIHGKLLLKNDAINNYSKNNILPDFTHNILSQIKIYKKKHPMAPGKMNISINNIGKHDIFDTIIETLKILKVIISLFMQPFLVSPFFYSSSDP